MYHQQDIQLLDDPMAIKACRQPDATLRELGFLRKVQGSLALPRLIGSGNVEFGGTDYIVMRAYDEISRDNFNYDYVRQDLLRAVARLRKGGICHNNVKPENVMFDPEGKHFILIDLGNAALQGESVLYADNKFVPPDLRGRQAPAVFSADEYAVHPVLDQLKREFGPPSPVPSASSA